MAENSKKVFLLATSEEGRLHLFKELVEKYASGSVLYTANNRINTLAKLRNAHVDVIILDHESRGFDLDRLVDDIFFEPSSKTSAIIITGHPPKKEKFIDEIVIGKMSFLSESSDEHVFSKALARALTFASSSEDKEFHLRYLSPGEVLMREGELGKCVYIVKSGELVVYLQREDQKKILGTISTGEFVGEMAYINNQPRSADVAAKTMTELIEIPFGVVETIIFSRPSWSKALMQSLTKRLKIANKMLSEN